MELTKVEQQQYEEFFLIWRPAIERQVKADRILSNSADDVIQKICLDFIKGKYLDIYDPNKASIATFVNRFVAIRLRGIKDQLYRKTYQEGISIDGEREKSDEDQGDGTGNLIALIENNSIIGVEANYRIIQFFEHVIDRLIDHRASWLVTAGLNKSDINKARNNYPVLLCGLLDGISKQNIAIKLGISNASISIMTKKLFSLVKEVVEADRLALPIRSKK